MKLILFFFIGMIGSFLNGIYDLSVVSLDGAPVPLSQFQGKKLLIVVLPVSRQANDISLLKAMDSISRKYSVQISVIGIPSGENGYVADSLASLKQFYGSLMGSQILLTQGMYTNKSSGSRQSALFAWLTDKNKNTHFDQDVKGPGHKFFIDQKGQLLAVFPPDIPLSDRTMQHLITP